MEYHYEQPGCIVAVCTTFTVAVLRIISSNREDAIDIDETARPIPSTNDERASNHRHLFHIYDVHSSQADRFKVIDLNCRRKLHKSIDVPSFNCTTSKSVPSFNICVYDREKDKFISAGLLSNGIWEPHITRAFQVALSRFPDAAVIDVGANIGYYSLLASAMGNKVIAIEPQDENIKRFVAGVCADRWSDNIILLANALSDSHKNVSLSRNEDNQGGIRVLETCQRASWVFGKTRVGEDAKDIECNISTLTLNDLLYITTTREAVIKVDIEGYECRALATASRFFSLIKVPYVFMEWKQMRERQHLADTACRPEQIRALSDFFSSRGYVPHEIRSGIRLDPFSSENWMVGDIYWRARGQDLLVPSL